MKTPTAILAGVLLISLGCRASDQEHDTQPHPSDKTTVGETPKERKVLFWRAPMDPNFVSDQPGKSPMGMDLVPVYEDEAGTGEDGAIRIDPETIQNIGVKTTIIERMTLEREIRAVGRVAYDETKMRAISSKVRGWIERQHIDFTGQVVDRGAPLLEIYSPELVATQEEYLLALRYRQRMAESPVEAVAEGAGELVRAAEARLRYWDIGEPQILNLRESKKAQKTMTLHAPFSGVVVKKKVLEGGFVQPGQTLYELADLSTVWIYADIYEYEIPWIAEGLPAEITLSHRPGIIYEGRVAYVYPYLKDSTRTLQVRIELSNTPDFDLKPDMWANVMIRSEASRNALAVPIQAVIRTGKRDIVLIAKDGGRFAPREVRLGAETGENFEILDGVEEGERVVVSAQFLINSESNLRSALGKMAGDHSN
jgi:RND family efflux transporter MFP subunit